MDNQNQIQHKKRKHQNRNLRIIKNSDLAGVSKLVAPFAVLGAFLGLILFRFGHGSLNDLSDLLYRGGLDGKSIVSIGFVWVVWLSVALLLVLDYGRKSSTSLKRKDRKLFSFVVLISLPFMVFFSLDASKNGMDVFSGSAVVVSDIRGGYVDIAHRKCTGSYCFALGESNLDVHLYRIHFDKNTNLRVFNGSDYTQISAEKLSAWVNNHRQSSRLVTISVSTKYDNFNKITNGAAAKMIKFGTIQAEGVLTIEDYKNGGRLKLIDSRK